MKKTLAALALVFMMACERPVEISRVKGQEFVERQYCNSAFGYCRKYTYLGNDPKTHQSQYGYRYRISNSCPGHRNATVRKDTVGYHYESGKKPDFTRIEKVQINYLEDCK